MPNNKPVLHVKLTQNWTLVSGNDDVEFEASVETPQPNIRVLIAPFGPHPPPEQLIDLPPSGGVLLKGRWMAQNFEPHPGQDVVLLLQIFNTAAT